MVRENARFSGVEIITQCVMGNHFHLLVRVAAQSAVSDAELLRRASGYYGKKSPYRKLLEQTFSEFANCPKTCEPAWGHAWVIFQ